jgi:hypothetical protein
MKFDQALTGILDNLEPLSDEDYGKMIRCIHKYNKYGIEPAPEQLSPHERSLFAFAKDRLDKRQDERPTATMERERRSYNHDRIHHFSNVG